MTESIDEAPVSPAAIASIVEGLCERERERAYKQACKSDNYTSLLQN